METRPSLMIADCLCVGIMDYGDKGSFFLLFLCFFLVIVEGRTSDDGLLY